jgi:thioredoxin-dependent peroxiredoxin
MSSLTIGQPAPNFEFTTENGEKLNLSSFAGKKIVLYFYPKDNTPGCTDEACNLRDNNDLLLSKGYVVIGVSPDSDKSHAGFRAKHNLPFHLIADTEKTILQAYNAWGEKSMYGKKYMGVIRTTYIISEDGKIERIIDKVKTKDHTSQILV